MLSEPANQRSNPRLPTKPLPRIILQRLKHPIPTAHLAVVQKGRLFGRALLWGILVVSGALHRLALAAPLHRLCRDLEVGGLERLCLAGRLRILVQDGLSIIVVFGHVVGIGLVCA